MSIKLEKRNKNIQLLSSKYYKSPQTAKSLRVTDTKQLPITEKKVFLIWAFQSLTLFKGLLKSQAAISASTLSCNFYRFTGQILWSNDLLIPYWPKYLRKVRSTPVGNWSERWKSTNKREKHPNSHRQNEKTENKEKSQHKQYNLPETFHILLNNES